MKALLCLCLAFFSTFLAQAEAPVPAVTINKELTVEITKDGKSSGKMTFPQGAKFEVIKESGENLIVNVFVGEATISKNDCDFEAIKSQPASAPQNPPPPQPLTRIPADESKADSPVESQPVVVSGRIFQITPEGLMVSGRLYFREKDNAARGPTFTKIEKFKWVASSERVFRLHGWPGEMVSEGQHVICRILERGDKSYQNEAGVTWTLTEIEFTGNLTALDSEEIFPQPKKKQPGPTFK